MRTTLEIMQCAKKHAPLLKAITTDEKNKALLTMADCLEKNCDEILKENKKDVENAKDRIPDAMIDRLSLDANRIKSMADGMREVASLPDPIGNVISTVMRPNGLKIEKVSSPLGVCAIIYESRPNVTSDAASLAFKSSNAVILRSGKDAFHTSFAIVKALQEGLEKCSLPKYLIQIVEDTTRTSANELMKGNGYIDLLIPRGNKGLIQACVENATVPCIETGTGICHIFVEKSADINMALNIIENAKTSRVSVCNACEVLLVDREIAPELLPRLKQRLTYDRKNAGKTPVELRGCEETQKFIDVVPAEPDDFDTEFLDYILAVKIVDTTPSAIEHIANHSTHHSEAIITSNEKEAELFTNSVDSAAVYVNTSTRFTDGGEFGLGCEMGISTQKLHARGPMGLEELTTYKYIIHGNGQIR